MTTMATQKAFEESSDIEVSLVKEPEQMTTAELHSMSAEEFADKFGSTMREMGQQDTYVTNKATAACFHSRRRLLEKRCCILLSVLKARYTPLA